MIHDSTTAQSYAANFASMWTALDTAPVCNEAPPTFTNAVYIPLLTVPDDGQPPTPAANVQIVSVLYNPDGDDVASEYVLLENKGDAAAVMNGWQLQDEIETTYTFPGFTLAAGAQVKVWVKTGSNGTTDLYWGRGSAVWNNTGDVATLLDETQAIVAICAYEGGGSAASCDGSEPPPPPPPPASDIQLDLIVYNPDGDDVVGEYVQISNTGAATENMTNWTLSDEASATFTFPSFTLNAGVTVRVWVKAGTNTATDLYWGRGSAVWNNNGDTATLRDGATIPIDICSYTGGGSQTTCS